MFTFSAHSDVKNKLPSDEAWKLGSGWISKTTGLNGLRDWVLGGNAFVCAAMHSEHRTSAAFKHADFIGVDIDHGLTIDQFLAHPLAKTACWGYTTCSHNPEQGAHRYRVLFRLPERIEDAGLYTALYRVLQKSLGADPNCKDPCRAYYGNSEGQEVCKNAEAVLGSDLISAAKIEQRQSKEQTESHPSDYDEFDIAKAEFILQRLDTHQDRDRFMRISHACASQGDRLFGAWSDWAAQTHHGQGENAHRVQKTKWFNGVRQEDQPQDSLLYCRSGDTRLVL